MGTDSENILSLTNQLSILRWLGHSLPKGDAYLLCLALFPVSPPGMKKPHGDQYMAWQRSMGKRTTNCGKAGVSSSRLGPERPVNQ